MNIVGKKNKPLMRSQDLGVRSQKGIQVKPSEDKSLVYLYKREDRKSICLNPAAYMQNEKDMLSELAHYLLMNCRMSRFFIKSIGYISKLIQAVMSP